MTAHASSFEALAEQLDHDFASIEAIDRLRHFRRAAPGRLVFTTSFGLEDQVLADLLASAGVEAEIATLDTGRLFPETYEVWTATEERYGRRIRAYCPEQDALEALISDQGVNGFYGSVAMRKACCRVRKVEPLERALAGAEGWITGLRADQSEDRQVLPFVSFDATRGLLKANPLLDWTRERALAHARERAIPLNQLHDRGFPSIGCAPCTRAVRPGEPERAGRWWWENDSAKECGLHLDDQGRLTRAERSNETWP